MSKRLSDEELARMEPFGKCQTVNVPAEMQRALLNEVRAARQRELSEEQVEALRWVRYWLVSNAPTSSSEIVSTKRALSALDKLTGQGGERG